jgi:hypothetical protein
MTENSDRLTVNFINNNNNPSECSYYNLKNYSGQPKIWALKTVVPSA